MKSRSLFSWLPPCWVASDSQIPLLLTLALLKTVVNLIPLYFRVLGKEADRTENSLTAVLSLMVSLNLTLVNNVSTKKLCSTYLIFFFLFQGIWFWMWHLFLLGPWGTQRLCIFLRGCYGHILYNFIPHLLIINIYLNILLLWSWFPL